MSIYTAEGHKANTEERLGARPVHSFKEVAARDGGDFGCQALRVAIAGEMPAAREAGP